MCQTGPWCLLAWSSGCPHLQWGTSPCSLGAMPQVNYSDAQASFCFLFPCVLLSLAMSLHYPSSPSQSAHAGSMALQSTSTEHMLTVMCHLLPLTCTASALSAHEHKCIQRAMHWEETSSARDKMPSCIHLGLTVLSRFRSCTVLSGYYFCLWCNPETQ